MLSSKGLIDWLVSLDPQKNQWQGFSYVFSPGPYVSEMPDKLVTVTLLDGAGWFDDGASDQPFFQIRVRSAQNNQLSAEQMAFALDQAIYNQHFPQTTDDGTVIQLVTRQAGAPATLGPPEMPSMRFDYVCTYRTVVAL